MDRLLPTPHDDDVLYARRYQVFNNVLNNRLIYNWQHLFGHSLGLRQKSRSEARRRNNGFCYSFV